jgi:hypothetical protein
MCADQTWRLEEAFYEASVSFFCRAALLWHTIKELIFFYFFLVVDG